MVPVMVQGAEMPREPDVPVALKALVYQNAIDIRPGPRFPSRHDATDQGNRSARRAVALDGRVAAGRGAGDPRGN